MYTFKYLCFINEVNGMQLERDEDLPECMVASSFFYLSLSCDMGWRRGHLQEVWVGF